MAHTETFHLPSVTLEVDFAGDEAVYDLKMLRCEMKQGLRNCLVSDGVAFQQRESSEHWKKGEGPDSRLESVLDGWICTKGYPCAKEKDRHGGKMRWVLQCGERVTILLVPNEG